MVHRRAHMMWSISREGAWDNGEAMFMAPGNDIKIEVDLETTPAKN